MRARNSVGFLALVMMPLLFGGGRRAEAVVLFSNLGIGDSFDVSSAWLVGDVAGTFPLFLEQAMSFSPPAGSDYRLDRIELAVSHLVGPNLGMNVTLWGGTAAPTTVLGGFHLESFLLAEPAVVGADSLLRPTLVGGAQYWLSALPSSRDAIQAWYLNDIGDLGDRAERPLAIWSTFADEPRGAFRVTGTPVSPIPVSPIPEPASFLLVSSGLLGLAGWRRRLF